MWSKAPSTSSESNSDPEKGECSKSIRVASWRIRTSEVFHIMKAHPVIPLFCILLFGVLVGCTVAIVHVVRESENKTIEDEARTLAVETGNWFSAQLQNAILPLFSLAQFAIELEIFQDLPHMIGPANETGSAPHVPETVITHRNVTGICDDLELINRFNQIASTLKRNAQMEGILINLELAPNGVVCLVYPLNNTEDFTNGIFYDSSAAVGHDLLVDPLRQDAAEAAITSNMPVVAGPLKLRGCHDCDPSVEQAFIVRLPIEVPGYTMDVQGVSYNRWGLAIAIVNWRELVRRSGIYEDFQAAQFQFSLAQVVRVLNPETNTFDKSVVVLAETDKFENDKGSPGHVIVSTELDTSYNEWVMSVGYTTNDSKFYLVLAVGIVISFAVTCLLFTIMVQSQLHSIALTAKSSQLIDQATKAAKRERELNDFIAHEVRNPLAAAISACNFISASVAEKEPLTDEESRRAVREDVIIIEISLQFINDLLRSMLDLSRASDKQLELDLAPVDVLHDILQPVSSMLYSRDHLFEVIVECPENLIIMADRLRLKQVMVNLGRNSVKFVEEGFVRLRAKVVEGSVHIYIDDSGPGIPEDKRKNLFCKFQESLDVLSQGTGIGLSLCEHLVDLMGGSVRLDESYHSGVGNNPGARFDVNLNTPPLRGECDESMRESSRGLEIVPNGNLLPEFLEVLFVDDDMLLRKLFCRSVRKALPQWTISEAASGEAALSLVATRDFDIILMDQYMTSAEKNLLGTETVRLLRAQGCKAKICGLSANDIQAPFKAAGADAFVMKPFPCKEGAMKHELSRILFAEVPKLEADAA